VRLGRVHPQLGVAAARQMGVVTMADARRAGYAHSEVQRLCATGEWVRLRRGAYATSSAVSGGSRHRSDCVAVLLALRRPSAAVSHASAARLLGLPVPAGDDVVRLTDPTRSRSGSGFSMVRSPLATEDLLVRGPLRLTTVARTLGDCARTWPLEAAVAALDAGLAPTALQVEIRSGGRLVAGVDAWYEEAAIAVEFDGRVTYTQPWREPGRVLWEEKRREDALRALGIRVVRIADEDLGPSWRAVESHLTDLLARPGPTPRRFAAVARERGRVRSA
jgi:hypothetical protein